MPIYEYGCQECGQIHEVVRDIASCGEAYKCDSCGANTTKLFSLTTCRTFPAYTDGVMGEVRSHSQEKRLLKKHGKVLVAETKQWDKFKEQRKKAIKKPIISTSAATTRMNRD